MTPLLVLRLTVWVSLAGGAIALGCAIVAPYDAHLIGATPRLLAPSGGAARYPAESLGQFLVSQDPFRAARRSAAVAYDPVQPTANSAPPPPRPTLVVDGILWGREPEAIIEGWPGIDGSRVVRTGDRVAGLTVRGIRPRQVVITDGDTTWTMTVREPWH
jgi:hypothetical protein